MIKCDYCGNVVKDGEVKCPHCGGNLASAYDKRDKENASKVKETTERITEKTKEVIEVTKKTSSIFAIFVFLIMIGAFVTMIYIATNAANLEIPFFDSKEDKKQVLDIGDVAKLKNMEIIVDSYEPYEYTTDIESYTMDIAQKGFQQVAFHIKEKNITNNKIASDSQVNIELLADGIQMDNSSVKCNKSFMKSTDMCKTFKSFNLTFITSGGTYDGWVGFYVNKSAKKLELHIGSYVVYELDNPYYEN